MSNQTIREKFVSLMPYFLLALLIIAAYRLSGEMAVFFNFFRWGWGVISPFFYGFLLAYVINIPCGSIQKLLARSGVTFLVKRKKMFSLIIVMLIFATLIFLTLNLVIPAIVDSINFFRSNIENYIDSMAYFFDYFNGLDLFGLSISTDEIFSIVSGLFSDFTLDMLAAPLGAIVGAANAVFRGAIAFISSIYIMVEKERCKAYINRLLRIFASDRFRNATIEIFTSLNKNLRQYIHTQTIDGIILGTMATVVLFLLGSPYALVLGIMLGIVNYVPYFGSLFGTLTAVIVVIFTQGFGMGVIAAGVLLVVQQIDANIVQPRLMSGSFSMSPLLVIISITIGGAIAGILGMIVVIPIVAVLKDMFEYVVEYYEREKFGRTKR